jgi:homoserine acetyltransferase
MPSADGKMRLTDMADTETLLRLIQSIPSPKAEPFKLWLAKVGYERIQDMSDPARSLDRAREYWQKHGRSEKWIQQRMMGQETRNKLTDYWKGHDIHGEEEFKSKRKLVQEKLIKFATRIPAFMYLTDFRENTLQDVITKIEPDLFETVTGLTVKDFHLLVRLKVFNTEQMNQAVFAFRRYEDASLRYTGIESHPGLTHHGLYDTVVARE